MGSTDNKRDVEQAERRARGARRGELDQLRYVMGEALGRAMIWRVLERTGAEVPLPFSTNAMSLSRDAGVQSVGFWLLGEVRAACPEQEVVMRREAALRAERQAMAEDIEDDR